MILRRSRRAALVALLACAPGLVRAAPPPPGAVRAFDTPDDGGGSITVTWDPPAGPEPLVAVVQRVETTGLRTEIARVPAAQGRVVDGGAGGSGGPVDGFSYVYAVRWVDAAGDASAATATDPVVASGQWFHRGRTNILVILAVFAAFLAANVLRTARGARMHIRRLRAVDAIDEAIGRATEMGRPVLYVPGIEEVEDIQTIASMLILGKIAEKTATYDVPLIVPTRTPFVLAVADEVVRTGCTAAGRPDAYRSGRVHYVSSEQFAYCAGVNGEILRERPAANLYLGRFFAESLIFAETGFAAGSIQIAGTAEVTQLPFFIAACDYTLIGEEFFAAGAYLSGDPALLSTLRAADWAKVVLVICLGLGSLLVSLGQPGFREWFQVR